MTAYAYIRKSSVRDPKKDLSPAAQEAAVRELARRNGDETGLVVLTDLDISGRLGREKRPGYDRLWRAIESGKCSALYSYSLSRLGRSVAELAHLVGECVQRKIPVRLYADAVDTSTASGMLLFHVLAAVAQFEAEVASERVRAANTAKIARGQRLGPPRYGELPGQSITAVLDAFHEAGSYSGAAKLLNERGVPTRLSRRGWWPSSVSVVVQEYEPQTAKRVSTGVRAKGSFVLARLLRCPTCTTLLTGTRDRGGKRVRYSCRLGTSLPHPRISVTESHILPWVKAEVEKAAVAIIRFTPADDVPEKRRVVEARLDRYRTLFGEGEISQERWEAERKRARDELAALPDPDVVLARDPRFGPLVDFTLDDVGEINSQLRSVFRSITLDAESFQPISADWLIPGWRSSGP